MFVRQVNRGTDLAFDVDSRLVRERVSGLDKVIAASAEVWLFVDLQSNTCSIRIINKQLRRVSLP